MSVLQPVMRNVLRGTLPSTVVANTYVANAVEFDGISDSYDRTSALTGVSDSKLFTCVVWIDPKAAATGVIWQSNAFPLTNGLSWFANFFRWDLEQTDGTSVFTADTGTLSLNAWYPILFSVDLGNTLFNWYHGDTDLGITPSPFTDAEIDWESITTHRIGEATNGSNDFTGCMAELWFAPGVYIDFSVEANRRKFIDANGKPVSLGDNGELPTETAPLIYLNNAASTFGTNKGSGGNFTLTGNPAVCVDSPSS